MSSKRSESKNVSKSDKEGKTPLKMSAGASAEQEQIRKLISKNPCLPTGRELLAFVGINRAWISEKMRPKEP